MTSINEQHSAGFPDTYSELDDIALLDRWADGSKASGDELLQRHVQSLTRFFASRVPHAAEDLVQTTLLACVESRDRLRERTSFKSYLFGIARHQLCGYYRRRGIERNRQRFNTTSVYCPAVSPSTAAVRQNQDVALLSALRALPSSMQTLLMLKYWEDLSPEEIAEVLAIPTNAVHNRLHRAKRRLREALGAFEPAHAP